MKKFSPKMISVLVVIKKCGSATYLSVHRELPDLSVPNVGTYLQRLRSHGFIEGTKTGRCTSYTITADGEKLITTAPEPPARDIHGIGPFPFKPVRIPKINSVWKLGASLQETA